MNERRAQILDLLTEGYILSARPVASAKIAEEMKLSSATVRNELGALELEGYVQQPHTSAGRVPTGRAYRRYARKFLPPARLPNRQRLLLRRRLEGVHGDSLLHSVAGLAADLSGYAVVVSLLEDDALQTLEIHLSALSQSRLLAGVVLESGLVRQLVIELDPVPSGSALSKAESSLRQLTLPVGHVPAALTDIAAREDAEVARTFRALAASWPRLRPPILVHQGLKYLMTEPESADPRFVRALLERVESPGQPGGSTLEVTVEDALAAVSARLALGGGGCLMLIGPVRMRYPQALMVAHGVVEAVAQSLHRDAETGGAL
ncbi:HrcA family transcriptional regulator [soil metagenome]